MTKQVRIENADISNHKIVIKTQVKNELGEWVDLDDKPIELFNPTEIYTGYIWKEKRLVIEEV